MQVDSFLFIHHTLTRSVPGQVCVIASQREEDERLQGYGGRGDGAGGGGLESSLIWFCEGREEGGL